MKKIIIFSLFLVFIFSSHSSLAAYPTTCPTEAQGILSAVGGCSAIDCGIYSNICAKCCVVSCTSASQIPLICKSDEVSVSGGKDENGCPLPPKCVLKSSICTSFSYSNWSACQSNSSQTRIVVSQSPAGCSGGNPVTTQTCSYLPLGDDTDTTPSISDFKSSKTEIVSGNTVTLSFSGSNVSKYKIYFSCPKFSTGLNAGLLAASVKISGTEYCNKDFTVPTGTLAQNLIISSKYSKPLKITSRLKAHDSQDQYVDYKDVIITVNAATTSTVPTTSTATSLQEQINFLLNQIKVLQQQLSDQQSSTVPTTQTTQVSINDSSASPASTSESVTETALSNDSAIFSYTWNKDLYYGMRNDNDVKALQKALIKEGVYSGEITGNFFGLTKQAVIDFQKKHNFTNIPGTGYTGTYTRKVLNELYSK